MIDLKNNGTIQKHSSPDSTKTPKYYCKQSYYAWFEFTEITLCDKDELKKYSYVDCPDLFADSNIDYSKFNNKKIHSIGELIQQNRTVWFIRDAKDSDPKNEIVLLDSESVQPTHFSTKYYQSSGNALLWLSDLHFSASQSESRDKTLSQTLAGHISRCIADA